MAARKNPVHLQAARDKIKTSQLINRLQANALGELALNPVQQKSIEILLRKCLPDISAIQHEGIAETRYVIAAPSVACSPEDWLAETKADKPH